MLMDSKHKRTKILITLVVRNYNSVGYKPYCYCNCKTPRKLMKNYYRGFGGDDATG